MEEITIKYRGSKESSLSIGGVALPIHPSRTSPLDLLAAALGGCTLTLMGIEAERLGVDLSDSYVTIKKRINKTLKRRFEEISIDFFSPESFSIEVEEALRRAGTNCPVHYSLHPEITKNYTFTFGLA